MSRVQTGLERWLGGAVRTPSPRGRLGLVCHPASIDSAARHARERLGAMPGAELVRLFAPEHGIDGHEQDMERVAAGRERTSGLPVISLYGASADSLRPRPDELLGLDAIVCDLQDVGSRYYTFVYTLAHVMEAAGEAGLPVIVLDRPNPLGGERIEGPRLDPAWSSFVGRYPLPVRHGMTVGELALLFQGEFGVRCELHVVPLGGWRRSMLFEETGLPWVPPSPNMPALSTARVYPGGCLIEGTNLSEARGTTLPFEQCGAPWLDAEHLARALRAAELPGVLFRAASFRPMFHKHAGEGCRGVQVIVEDKGSFRPFLTYLALIGAARRLAPAEFAWRTEVYEFERERLAIDLLLGRAELRTALETGATLAELEALWAGDEARFAELRRPYLLYE